MRKFALITSYLFLLLSSSSVFAVSGGPSDLFPNGRTAGEFVSAVFDQRAIDIGKRLTTAWSKDQAFFSKYAERYASEGNGLPWHAKMDVSRQEYDYMLEKYRHPSLKKVADAIVMAEQKGQFIVISASVAGSKLMSGASAIKFNTKTGELIVGKKNYGRSVFNPGKSPLDLAGRFVPGYEWSLSKGTGKSRAQVGYVHIGRITQEQGKCLLNLSVFEGVPIPLMGSYRYNCR